MPQVVVTEGTPGGGKTTLMISEYAEFVESGVSPNDILVLTFTRSAQKEARTRIHHQIGIEYDDLKGIRTLHSYAIQCLGLNLNQLVGEFDRMKFLTEYGWDIIPDEGNPFERAQPSVANIALAVRSLTIAYCYKTIAETVKALGLNLGAITSNIIDRILSDYREYKRKYNRFDFDDVIQRFSAVKHPEFVFVDEAQDLTLAQWKCVLAIASRCKGLYIFRDTNQSIFRWAGADPTFVDRFKAEHRLINISWRLPEAIASIPHRVLQLFRNPINAGWRCNKAGGEVQFLCQEMLDEGSDPFGWNTTGPIPSTLVITRTRFQMLDYKQMAHKAGRLYSIKDVPINREPYIRAGAVMQKLKKGMRVQYDDARLLAMNSSLFRPVSDDSVDNIHTFGAEDLLLGGDLDKDGAMLFDRMTMDRRIHLEALMSMEPDLLAKPRINISTAHAVKGMEADHVIVDVKGTPRTLSRMGESASHLDFDEEMSVWYVATSRARKKMTILYPANPLQNSVPVARVA